MATATTSFGLSKPSIRPPKILNSPTTLKFCPLLRPTIAYSNSNRLTDSSKLLNAATATCTSSSTSTIRKKTTQGTSCAKYMVQDATGKLSFFVGKEELMEHLKKRPEALGDAIPPENGIAISSEIWDAQCYGFESPLQWPSSSGLGAMSYVSPPAKHQMWAAQGHGFKVQSVEFTSSGLRTVRNTVCSHDQCEIFAAEGYDRVSGNPGVSIATSGPGATNLSSGLTDALPDNVSSVSITSQVPRCSATHQQQPIVPTWDPHLDSNLDHIPPAIFESKKPVLYVGGGCLNSSAELDRFVQLTGIPVASTLQGLGTYPLNYPLSLGMHGTVDANYAMQEADLLLAFGVRFDDRVTGKLEEFAGRAKIVHIDIDPAEIGKNKQPHISVCADLENSLDKMNKLLEERIDSIGKLDFSAWIEELMEQKKRCTLWFNMLGKAIPKEYERKVLDEWIIVGVITAIKERQHQMRAAREYRFKGPRQWATSSGIVPVPAAKGIMWATQCYGLKAQVVKLGTSSGLRAMGFGLDASKHQMWAAQGYGFKDQLVELCTSSGLGAMGCRLHVAKYQMWAAQGYSFKAELVELGTSSGLGAMGVGLLAAQDQMWTAQMYGFKGARQFAISSGLGAVGFGLPAAIVVCVVQKKGNPFLWIKKNKVVKLGIICLEMVELFQFIRKKLGIMFPEIVELFQTGP